MLVLERFENEKILIGDDIVIQVVRISRDKVRLGIECPKRISVDRDVQPSVMDPKGVAGANAEMEMYRSGDHKQIYQRGSKQFEG